MKARFILVAFALTLITCGGQAVESSPYFADAAVDQTASNGCPVGFGPQMVLVPDGLCMDRTEVTRAQYEAWLATNPKNLDKGVCATHSSFKPDEYCMGFVCQGSDCGSHPQTCVDYCDALNYCLSSGKRICRADINMEDWNLSEWARVCSQGLTTKFPWGDQADSTRCHLDGTTTAPVGSYPGCHGALPAYAEVVDLIGNAAEWNDHVGYEDTGPLCTIRGGSFRETGSCGGRVVPMTYLRNDLGFRCCADPI